MLQESLAPSAVARLRGLAYRLSELDGKCCTRNTFFAQYSQLAFMLHSKANEAEYGRLIDTVLHILRTAGFCVGKEWPEIVQEWTGRPLPDSLPKGAAGESAFALATWLDGMAVNSAADDTPEDGPGEQGVFHYNGKSANGIAPKPWFLLKLAWERRPTAVDLAEVGEQVWGSDAIATSVVRTAASKANTALSERSIPLQLHVKGERLLLE